MEKDEKRIVVRVEREKWTAFDDQRHAEHTTFQKLGLRIFDEWLKASQNSANGTAKSDINSVSILSSSAENERLTEEESKWVACLLRILRSGNDVALRAVLSNLIAFSDYVRAVPEVPDGFANLAAQARRIAALDEQLMDAIKAATVGRVETQAPTGVRPKKHVGGK